jgi:CBS domain-containing protein
MNAYELCQRRVITARRTDELSTAVWVMRERNVGCLVVVDPAGIDGGWRPVGLLTDRDIVTNVFARDRDPYTVVVDEVMTRHPVTLISTASIEEALRRMRAADVRRLPLVDERGRLAGILALDDIFDHLAQRVPFGATPIRPDLRVDQKLRAAAAQPGSMGIDRI